MPWDPMGIPTDPGRFSRHHGCVIRAVSTLYDSSLFRGKDRPLGGATLWSLTGVAPDVARVVPDLSCDLVWPADGKPTLLERTISTFEYPVAPGVTIVGLRFAPAVVAVQVDWGWGGWQLRQHGSDRATALHAALVMGAVRAVVDPRLDALLSALFRHGARTADVADELGVSERQMLRWAQGLTGLTVKQLQRNLRLRRFCEASARLPLAERSIQAGFYDQAHASNEIRSIAAVSASSLAAFRMADSSKTAPAGVSHTRGQRQE